MFEVNAHNKTKMNNTISKYIGVTYDKERKRYRAQIRKDRKHYNLGKFTSEKEAAEAYNKKAIELYGEYANLNIIE